MKNNLKIMLTVMFAAAMLTACGNVDEVVSERNVVSSASVSSTAASTTAESATTLIGTSETTTAAVTTSKTVTTTPIVTKAAATTTTPAAAVTTTTTAKTTVTTPKPTTTTTAKKPATTTTTTTTVTTTKKATTTTPKVTTTKKTTTTAKKPAATTTTAKPAAKLTQKDIDKLVKELQEYSNQKAASEDGYKQYFPENGRISFEEAIAYNIENKTPETSSWDSPGRFSSDNWTYEEMRKRLYNKVDGQYSLHPNSHIVLHPEYHNDEYGEYWLIYPLR